MPWSKLPTAWPRAEILRASGLGSRASEFRVLRCCVCDSVLLFLFEIGASVQLPIVSIVVPFFGLTSFMLRIRKRTPQKGTTMETIGEDDGIFGFLRAARVWPGV